jgi:hypothetical protein
MNTHLRRTHRSSDRRAMPTVETLEDRRVPATTVTFGAGTLTILGDGTSNVITISDAGNGSVGSVSVSADGVTTANTGAITALNISVGTLGGSDVVRYNLTGDLASTQSRTLNANLGDKNDLFQASFVETLGDTADLATGASLTFNINGQKGRDRIFFAFPTDVDINTAAALVINASGGRDRDTIALNYFGQANATLNFNLNGGQDHDRIAADLALNDGSTGTVTGQVRGQGGDDFLALLFTAGDGLSAAISGTLKGNAGFDRAIVSALVAASGVEDLFRLP